MNTDPYEQKRGEHRFGVKIRAFVINPHTRARLPCLIRDGSLSGCRLMCGRLDTMPDDIIVEVPELAKPVYGKMVWRNPTEAGVKFMWETTPADERRASPRQKVDMAAIILDRDYRRLRECTICDASRTGCRLSTPYPETLPDEICLEIRGLTEPMLGKIVWRDADKAGIEFVWDSDAYLLDMKVEVQDSPTEQHKNQEEDKDEEAVWQV